MQSPIILKIADIVVERQRTDLGNIAGLAESISDIGLQYPPIVRALPDGRYAVVDGRRRLEALKLLGDSEVTCLCDYQIDARDPDKSLRVERDTNEQRKSLTPSEKAVLYTALKRKEAAAATERKNAGQKSHNGGKARDKAASAVGMSSKTADKAVAVVEAAKADPSLAPVVEQMDATGNVAGAYKQILKQQAGPEDALGNPIADDRVRCDFEIGTELTALRSKLETLQKSVTEALHGLLPSVPSIKQTLSQMGVEFRSIKRAIESHIPYCIIPDSLKATDEARARGWATQEQFDRMTEAQKKVLRGARA